MATPVVTVASGGLPVVDVTAGSARGMPVSEAAPGRGIAVTKVAAGGMPVVYSSVIDYPPPFTPLSLTGLVGWWDPKVAASLSLSGSNLTAIANQGGPAGPLINSNIVPYSATGFNGGPGFTLVNGNSAMMFASSFPMGNGNTLTVGCVSTCATGASSTYGRLISYTATPTFPNDFDNAASFTIGNSNSTSAMSASRNNIGVGPLTGLAVSPAGHRTILTINSSGVMTLYVDGVAAATATSPGNWITNGNLVIGRQGAIGLDFWYGTVAEIVVATGFSPPATVAQLDAFLKTANRL